MRVEGIIAETKKKDEQIIENVRNDDRKVCIYGCGDIGNLLYEYLKENSIDVDFFVLDDAYCFCDEYHNVPVRKISSIEQSKEYLNVFVGFANFNKALTRLRMLRNVNVYCISNPCLYLQKYDLNMDFFYKNEDRFAEALSLFEDELSRKIFVAYLNTRINKNYEYMMPYGGCRTYFNNEIISLSGEEVYVDCGAYNGDSIRNFLSSVSRNYKKIYAIEPDKNNYEEIKNYVDNERLENIILINKGVWKDKAKLAFSDDGEQEGTIVEKDSNNYIEVDSLDNMLCGEKVTYIKLNVQGAEADALVGAENILKNDGPNIAAAIFMKPDALITIPEIIKRINPKYKLYLRCEDAFFARVILYAKIS